jgi:hypothetical protein
MSGRLKGLAAVPFAAAVLYAMQLTTPLYSEIISQVPVAGKQGERIDARDFALGVGKAHLARTLEVESYGRTKTYTTSGVWVLVEAAAEAKRESLALTAAEWIGPSGVRYALSQRFSSAPGMVQTVNFEPGLPMPFLLAFEVPENEAFGGTLLVSRTLITPLGEQIRMPVPDLRADDIRSTIAIGPGGGGLPWTLEAR